METLLEVLFYLVLIAFGGAVGSVVTQIKSRRNAAYGYFMLNPVEDPEDPGTYTVGVKFTDPIATYTEKIILYKQKSQE